jgi:ADP-dependent NAD(P)H-hydrate dehydratase / NAD(P)H-hydrate epimerase
MKIFSAAQIKKWDAFTISNEPITSIDLMERAATACCNWLIGKIFGHYHFLVFCGKGNNGGDGLAIARLLIQHGCKVTVYILEFGKPGTADFQINLQRLHECSTDIHFIQSPEFFPQIDKKNMVIDALFGSGLNKALEGISLELVDHINRCNADVVSIDIPGGLYVDKSSKGNAVIRATHTLTFQNQKLCFLLPENEPYFGEVHFLNIGLSKDFEDEEPATYQMNSIELVKACYRPRSKFSHKGNFGHAALLCGSYGMIGAAVLSSIACLRSGVGKLTVHIPKCGYDVLQTSVPEAMCKVAGEDFLSPIDGLDKYDAVGIGPGIGLYESHKKLLSQVFKTNQPVVVDADALNCLAQHKELLKVIPPSSILTPHPKEFERMFGSTLNDLERLELCMQLSKDLNVNIILKGHHSFISTPNGQGYFNNTGNPGMATAGSGDVLTGILTGLLAQGYAPRDAALMGVHIHGLAGGLAAAKYSQEAMIAGDITGFLGEAFKELGK